MDLCPPNITELSDDQLTELTRQQRRRDNRSLRAATEPDKHTLHFALACKRCGRRSDDPQEIAQHHNQLWYWTAADLCLPCSTPADITNEVGSLLDIVSRIYANDHRLERRRRRRRSARKRAAP